MAARDLKRATFPAGTVIPQGGTKIRAMQIIADLEGTTRGPYGGCVGYFSFNGNLDTCITIRKWCDSSSHPSPGLRPPSPAPAGEGQRRCSTTAKPTCKSRLVGTG